MSILALPTELLEHILILSAAGGFPDAIAVFAQTCKFIYGLVYNSTDQHLWREIFLTTFDDPRASIPGYPLYGNRTLNQGQPPESFDWGGEFRRRVSAEDYLRRQADPALDDEFVTDEDAALQNTRAFEVLLSVIGTALPCPRTFVAPNMLGDSTQSGSLPSPTSNYPTFPPLPYVIGSFSPGINGRPFGESLRSLNIAWLRSVLGRGLPARTIADFSGDSWTGGLAGQYLDEVHFRELQAAGHVIACTGFTPTPVPQPPTGASLPLSDTPASEGVAPEDTSTYNSSLGSRVTVGNQLKRARRLARMRVYNMRYLSQSRHWGPYLPTDDTRRPPPRTMSEHDELLQPILALFRVTPAHDHLHGDEDEEDEDEEEGEDEGEDADGEDEEQDNTGGAGRAHGFVVPDAPGGRGGDAESDVPTSVQLRSDWAYLAAVRVVVEANLRESFREEDLRGLLSLDGLRRGSAPWDALAYPPSLFASSSVLEENKGKGKAKETDGVDGWDWAGVTGIWKRCVCWMDYRDLILHNLSGEFEDPHLSEAVRIIAMRLHVARYSPSKVPGFAHLPTIHIIGETTGAGIAGQPRRMHGTVAVIADGSVRWTLYSTIEGGDKDEWVSEGVQVGGVGSAMGVLGMWTGAQHERMDPLGPCWAWKVG